MNIAILGAGGLGKSAAKIIEKKEEIKIIATCDKSGYIIDENGIVPIIDTLLIVCIIFLLSSSIMPPLK